MERSFSTKEIADLCEIHENTVRLYEKIGFITKPKRRENGYRVFTELQLWQCRLVRLAMRAEVLQNGLREKAVEIVKLSATQRYEDAIEEAKEYLKKISEETGHAREAIRTVERYLSKDGQKEENPEETECHEKDNEKQIPSLRNRKEAADWLKVTSETLRTWERSGLITIKRGKNGYRVYSREDMERLNIIKTLRCANYSLSSILRLLNKLDADDNRQTSIENVLNTPEENETIVSVCDRLVISLNNTSEDAGKILNMLEKIKTLQ